jgi:hypothetical protein
MVRLVLLFNIILFYSINIQSSELNLQEKIYFNFLDLNNDKKISFDEISKSIELIFQLIDEDQDGNISEEEIIELKNIIKSLS